MDAETRIPLTRPLTDEAEIDEIRGVLESGTLTQGPKVVELERMVAELVGTPHAFATTSATTALHLSLVALGIGPGDEVLVPDFTFPATANVVVQQGATPVLVDIDLDTYAMDVEDLERRITARSRAIMPVHPFGLPAAMGPIMEISERHGLAVVEDAACALGATCDGRPVGGFGTAGCFSFHPRKSITTGEGGMVSTDDEDLARTIGSLRDHGASASDYARHTGSGSFELAEYNLLGYNYRLTDLQAAVGSVQMDRADWILEERVRCATAYDGLLADIGWLQTPVTPDGHRHAYQAYVCLFRPEEPTLDNVERLHERRNAIMAELEALGIATRPGTHAAFAQGYYAQKYGLVPSDFPVAYLAGELSLALPLFPTMEPSDLEYVAEHLARAGRGL